MIRRSRIFAAIALIVATGSATGHEGQSELLEELIVYARAQEMMGVAESASEGSVNFDFHDRLEESLIQATIGEFGYYRGLVAGSIDAGSGVFTGALDYSVCEHPSACGPTS